LSAVDPALYAERMLNFVMQHTDYPEIMEERKKLHKPPVKASSVPPKRK
jgi:hypothetical protein